MKYETPQLSKLTDAINAVQASSPSNKTDVSIDNSQPDAVSPAYSDWEE